MDLVDWQNVLRTVLNKSYSESSTGNTRRAASFAV